MQLKHLTAMLLVMAHLAPAQTIPDAEPLPVAVEFATFRAGDGLTTLEVYLEIPSPTEIYALYGHNYLKELATAVLVKHRGQIVEFSDATLRDGTARSRRTDDAITATTSFTIRPGEYDLQIVVEDRAGIAFDKTFQVSVPTYSYNQLDVSDLVLARQVGWAGRVAATSRHGLKVTPAVPPVFDQNLVWIWYMLEVYGLSPEDTVALSSSIVNDSGTVVGPKLWRIPVPANTLTERGALLFENATPGNYRLILDIEAAGDSVTREAHFTIPDSQAVQNDTLSALIDLSKKDKKLLADDFKQVWRSFNTRGFSTSDTEEQLRRIVVLLTGLEGVTANDLIDRWQLVRLMDAGRPRRQGLSARSRLVLKNGPPQTVRIAPATFGQTEFQLWIYGDDGPIYFLVDIDGRGTFAEVDGELVPLLLLQSLSTTYRDSLSSPDEPPPAALVSPANVDSIVEAPQADSTVVAPDTLDTPVTIDSANAVPAADSTLALPDSTDAVQASDSTLAPPDGSSPVIQN